MRGRLYIFLADCDRPSSMQLLNRPPTLGELQAAVGGNITQVPGFLTYGEFRRNKASNCVAWCDEDARAKKLPMNVEATALWQTAMGMEISQWDQLYGTVVVLCGDKQLMRAL